MPEEFVGEMHTAEQLHAMLPRCEYVVVTLPHTTQTHHLIGRKKFKAMKKTAFLSIIGRGETVVKQELIDALKDGGLPGPARCL